MIFDLLWKIAASADLIAAIRTQQLKKANLSKGRDAKLPVYGYFLGQRGRQANPVR
jgi:hypothetical protein